MGGVKKEEEEEWEDSFSANQILPSHNSRTVAGRKHVLKTLCSPVAYQCVCVCVCVCVFTLKVLCYTGTVGLYSAQ